jgi:hypothetical protein
MRAMNNIGWYRDAGGTYTEKIGLTGYGARLQLLSPVCFSSVFFFELQNRLSGQCGRRLLPLFDLTQDQTLTTRVILASGGSRSCPAKTQSMPGPTQQSLSRERKRRTRQGTPR